MADLESIETQLRELNARLARVERLAYLTYHDVRHVAEYAYENAALERHGDVAKRMSKMKPLNDNEALKLGMSMVQLVILKRSAKLVGGQCRQDAYTLAAELATSLVPGELREIPKREAATADNRTAA